MCGSIVGVKAAFGEDLRRFSLSSCKFADLEENLKTIYSFGNANFVVKYRDDEGDLVTISSDAELKVACQLAQSTTLKVVVNVAPLQDSTKAGEPFVVSPFGEALVVSPSGEPVVQLASPPMSKHDRKIEKHESKHERKIGKKLDHLEKKAEKLQNKALKHGAARFVSDTFPDGTVVAPNQEFVKTWKIRNETLQEWPATYRFVFMKGENMSEISALHLPKSIAAGEEFEISIPMKAPSAVGKHISVFRLIGLNDRPFGQPFRVKIIVRDDIIPDPEMEKLLGDLANMGFTNRVVNEKVLRKFGGDMDKVVWKLSKINRKGDKIVEKKVRRERHSST